MNKRVIRQFLVAGILILAATGVPPSQAQTREKVLIRIPFAFVAGTIQLPAGEYLVSPSVSVNTMLSIQQTNGQTAALVFMTPEAGLRQEERTKLEFNRYGDRYFLSRFCVPGRGQRYEIRSGKWEREIAARRSAPSRVLLVGR